jgi:hypothetical protein
MALKINLYHEVLRTRKHAQYDPLRLSMYGLIAIVVALAGFYVVAYGSKSSVVSATAARKAEYARLLPKSKAAKLEEVELTKQLSGADNLLKRIEDRFYWAPVMEQIAGSVPPNVQLTHLTGGIAPDASRKCSMVIEGLAAGQVPRQVAEDLRVNIAEKLSAKFASVAVTFRSLEDGSEKVQLANTSEKLDTANFAISVAFLPKAEPTPTPAPGRAGRRAPKPESDVQP